MAGEQDQDAALGSLLDHVVQKPTIVDAFELRVEERGVVRLRDLWIISPILHVEQQTQRVEFLVGEEVEQGAKRPLVEALEDQHLAVGAVPVDALDVELHAIRVQLSVPGAVEVERRAFCRDHDVPPIPSVEVWHAAHLISNDLCCNVVIVPLRCAGGLCKRACYATARDRIATTRTC